MDLIARYNAVPIAELDYSKRLPQFEQVSEEDYLRKQEYAQIKMGIK